MGRLRKQGVRTKCDYFKGEVGIKLYLIIEGDRAEHAAYYKGGHWHVVAGAAVTVSASELAGERFAEYLNGGS